MRRRNIYADVYVSGHVVNSYMTVIIILRNLMGRYRVIKRICIQISVYVRIAKAASDEGCFLLNIRLVREAYRSLFQQPFFTGSNNDNQAKTGGVKYGNIQRCRCGNHYTI